MIVRLHAESPIHHGAFADGDTGNVSLLRRVPVAMQDGSFAEVPVLSGNALRGTARRLIMRELFDAAGVAEALRDEPAAYERLYAALANGGTLEGSEAAVRPAERAALRAALPPLSAFGAALYTYLLPGRIEVGYGWLVCRESVTAGLVASRDGVGWSSDYVRDLTGVRHVDRDQHDASVVTPMPYQFEALVAGSVLESRVNLRRASPLEAAAVAHALASVSVVGGKSSSGHGKVRVEIEDAPDATPYLDWLAGDPGAVRDALVSLARSMVAKAKKGKGAA